jgi:hypothetical protein
MKLAKSRKRSNEGESRKIPLNENNLSLIDRKWKHCVMTIHVSFEPMYRSEALKPKGDAWCRVEI